MEAHQDPMLGFRAALLAVLFFGSNYVPAKHVKVGDGVFFQFIMCVAIWVTSLPVLFYMAQDFPATSTEFGIAMMGGFLWCTGNMLCSFIIQLIGIGMGLLVWGSLNMLMGWASGCFGLFGLAAEPIAIPAWNYAGVSLALVGLALFLQVKPTDPDSPENDGDTLGSTRYESIQTIDIEDRGGTRINKSKSYLSLARSSSTGFLAAMSLPTSDSEERKVEVAEMVLPGESLDTRIDVEMVEKVQEKIRASSLTNNGISADEEPFKSWSSAEKRLVGFLCAIVAGSLFGCSFNPAQWIIDNHPNTHSPETLLSFVFPHYCGIVLCSFMYFVVYCGVMQYHLKRRPYVTPEVILPAVLSGVLWGIAEICWFVANQHLGFAIAFPLITSGPGFIGALWGIFMFDEIKGVGNLMTLGIAGVITVVALILVGLSH